MEGLSPVKLLLPFFLRLVTVRNSSVSRSRAVARRSGSGSKQRRMKALASSDMDSGISGWILNIPTCTHTQMDTHIQLRRQIL